MCELLEGLVWERPRNGTAETWGQWSHVEETLISRPVLCLLGPVICVVLAGMVLQGSDSPGFLHSGQGAVLKVGRCGPFPQATAWS